jgi:hypothetical protein
MSYIKLRLSYNGCKIYSLVKNILQIFDTDDLTTQLAEKYNFLVNPFPWEVFVNSKSKSIRKQKKFSQAKLAKKARLSVSTVKRFEDGYEIYGSDARAIASGLGAPLRDVVVIQGGGIFARERYSK